MAVTQELELFIRRLENAGRIFQINRTEDVLSFTVRDDMTNPWFTLENIIFDCNDTEAFICYTLNQDAYICRANISDTTPLDFGIASFIANTFDASLMLQKILVFIIHFCHEYSMGRGLELTSRNERSITFAGLQIAYRRNNGE